MAENRTTTGKDAYVTLLTRPSYLAGAILLAYTLTKHSPSTPLIITYTPETLCSSCIAALKAEAKHSNIILHPVEHLRLPDDGTDHGMVAERFIDTWTKLRVFDLHALDQKFERICWLDADMMVFSDPSPLIFNAENDAYLTGGEGKGNRLMAVHTCVCNLDGDAWAPDNWTPSNCAMSYVSSPDDVAHVDHDSPTLGNFNSGTFLFRPSPALSAFVHTHFTQLGTAALRAMKFPDQDFLNAAFARSWAPLSWRTNALKTWRYWHPTFWADDRVAVLHYIVDKPWAARVSATGKAGYAGKDGETHGWWWAEYAAWVGERERTGESELLAEVGRYVASEEGEVGEEMRAVGAGAQAFARKWEGRKGGGQKEAGENDGSHGPVLRKRMLGERGHGPVVRGGGIGGQRGGRGRGWGNGWSVMDP
ncbi:glycosyl transferase family protein [Pyrenochaeta sp. DS3sAY3a]|nr:glycosyl transferase family protein [Pyrenochaeta sp. DS3sAY3a]